MSKRGRRYQEEQQYEDRREPRRKRHRYEEPQPQRQEDIRIKVEAKTRGQAEYIQDIIKNDIIICKGPAGSGKTAIAVGMALQDLYSNDPKYKQIIVMRPLKEACDEHVGYLPGDLDDKLAPWAAPVLDNLMVFINGRIARQLFRDKKIEVVPLAYARGRSFNDSFIILDEAQNCTPKQMLMTLTRIGNNSKMIINGDISQNDCSLLKTGLEDAMDRLDGMHKIALRELDNSDIVRNRMISEIIERYQD